MQRTDSTNNLTELESGSFPEPPDKTPAQPTPCLQHFMRPQAENPVESSWNFGPEIKPASAAPPALQADSLPLCPLESLSVRLKLK